MALTKCKECGAKISTKAETCPSCGVKLKVVQNAFASLIGSLLSLAVFLWLGWMALDFFASAATENEKKSPTALLSELNAKCAASAKEAPSSMDKKQFYDGCVAGGRAQLRAQGIIK